MRLTSGFTVNPGKGSAIALVLLLLMILPGSRLGIATAAQPTPLSDDQAAEVGRALLQRLGWRVEECIAVRAGEDSSLIAAWGVKAAPWNVSARGISPDGQRNQSTGLCLDAMNGQLLMLWSPGAGVRDASEGPPRLSEEEARELAVRYVSAVGLPLDARIVVVHLESEGSGGDAQQRIEPVTLVVGFARFYGEARYLNNAIRVYMHPDTGKLDCITIRWDSPPPPDVEQKVSAEEAVELARKALAPYVGPGRPKEISGFWQTELVVVQPRKDEHFPYSTGWMVFSHIGEASRIAWAVRFSVTVPDHARKWYEELSEEEKKNHYYAEAYIDVEDGTLVEVKANW